MNVYSEKILKNLEMNNKVAVKNYRPSTTYSLKLTFSERGDLDKVKVVPEECL